MQHEKMFTNITTLTSATITSLHTVFNQISTDTIETPTSLKHHILALRWVHPSIPLTIRSFVMTI